MTGERVGPLLTSFSDVGILTALAHPRRQVILQQSPREEGPA